MNAEDRGTISVEVEKKGVQNTMSLCATCDVSDTDAGNVLFQNGEHSKEALLALGPNSSRARVWERGERFLGEAGNDCMLHERHRTHAGQPTRCNQIQVAYGRQHALFTTCRFVEEHNSQQHSSRQALTGTTGAAD